MTTNGVWAYTLNNTNRAVSALNSGQTLANSFTVLACGRHLAGGIDHGARRR